MLQSKLADGKFFGLDMITTEAESGKAHPAKRGEEVIKRRSSQRRPEIEIEEYVGRIDRTAMSYGLNSYFGKHDQPYPNKRSLYLFGMLVFPAKLRGFALEVTLTGHKPSTDTPDPLSLDKDVGHLVKHGARVLIYAPVPPDYIPALSSAFNDRRLAVFHGRGPPLRKRSCLLTSISFEDETHFIYNWGEPLPVVAASKASEAESG